MKYREFKKIKCNYIAWVRKLQNINKVFTRTTINMYLRLKRGVLVRTWEVKKITNAFFPQKADLAVADLTITYEREQGVDFTMPFMNLGKKFNCIITRVTILHYGSPSLRVVERAELFTEFRKPQFDLKNLVMSFIFC